MQQTNGFDPTPGVAELLEPGLWRIVAPNPSPMTFRGTNSYLMRDGDVAVLIDPGPDDPAHIAALVAALDGATLQAILVTHSHVDHSLGAPALARATGAPVLAYGDSYAGRSPVMQALAAQGLAGGGEGVDHGFAPDQSLADGEVLQVGPFAITALWTPGHFGNHMCFAWNGALFTGDHVMGWASSLVSPPDGDLTAFMASCTRLQPRKDRIYYPGHGAAVTDPAARLAWLIAHRQEREAQILAALGPRPATVPELTRALYTEVAPALLPMAERNVFAHLVDLHGRALALTDGPLAIDAGFTAPR